MRAVVLHGVGDVEHLRLEERPIRIPMQGSSRPVTRAALNHRDVWIRKGQYAGIKVPIILGSDGAGEVVDVGTGVDARGSGARS
jgi:NADPH:quinone reductase-like Zn-dependent oxidoreductase